jgi:hypothetical protein
MPILANCQKIAYDDVKRGAGSDDLSSWAKMGDIAGFSYKLLVAEGEFLCNGHSSDIRWYKRFFLTLLS